MLADIKDLFSWMSEKLNPLLANAASQHLVDAEKVVVTGSSAGGYLAYLSAVHALPRPKAIGTIYGMGGDLLSNFYLQPKTVSLHLQALSTSLLCSGPHDERQLISDVARRLPGSVKSLSSRMETCSRMFSMLRKVPTSCGQEMTTRR